jgi:hypothetical protein
MWISRDDSRHPVRPLRLGEARRATRRLGYDEPGHYQPRPAYDFNVAAQHESLFLTAFWTNLYGSNPQAQEN